MEGINENGYAMINSSLQGAYDTQKPKNNFKSKSKYLNVLSNSSFNTFQKLITNPTYYHDISLQGHTLFANPFFCVHMESFTNMKPVFTVLNNYSVFTNHGVNIKNIGNLTKEIEINSIIRKKIVEMELTNNKVNTYSDLFNILNKNYNGLDKQFHPYRYKNITESITTSQLLMDLNNKIFIFNYDKNNCNYIGIKNKLPYNYISKIKITVNEITKNI